MGKKVLRFTDQVIEWESSSQFISITLDDIRSQLLAVLNTLFPLIAQEESVERKLDIKHNKYRCENDHLYVFQYCLICIVQVQEKGSEALVFFHQNIVQLSQRLPEKKSLDSVSELNINSAQSITGYAKNFINLLSLLAHFDPYFINNLRNESLHDIKDHNYLYRYFQLIIQEIIKLQEHLLLLREYQSMRADFY